MENGHILVCGWHQTFPHNMEYLLEALNAPHYHTKHPVVFLFAGRPSRATWARLKQVWREIYFVQGLPVNTNHLHRAMVQQARRVLVIGLPKYSEESTTRSTDCLMQLAVATIKDMLQPSQHETVLCVGEHLHLNNLRFGHQ